MTDNAPTLPQGQPTLPPVAQQAPPAAAGAVQHDFSAGDNAQVMDSGGPKMEAGEYWWTLQSVEYRQSQDPQSGGAMLVIIEGVVLKNCSASGGTEAGAKRALVLHSNNSYGYWPGIKRLLAVLQELSDPNETRTNDLNTVLNDARTIVGATVKLSVVDKTGKDSGRPYKVFQYDGLVTEEEVVGHLATNPQLKEMAFPQGTRGEQGLLAPSAYFSGS